MPNDLHCPSEEDLIAFGSGLVTDADASRIGEHLDRCSTCCTAMETLHEYDPIAVALRRPVPEFTTAAEPSVASVNPERTISAKRVIQILSDCGLMDGADALKFLEALPPVENPRDGAELASALVQARKLTPYQAQAVLSGKGQTLLLGNYVVLDKIGQGGMGVVFQALHRRMNRVVALKVLSPRFGARPEFASRFQREIQAAAKLSHPNVVKALDAELTNARRFLVLEYIAGTDLSSLVKQSGKLPLRSAIDAVLQAARGLEYAHAQGIVHRDVKPSNLLRDLQGTIKLLDLGLARIMSSESGLAELTTTGAVMGTVDFMAPEQASDIKHADERADVYSLGITLWYLLTGRVAYEGGSAMSKLLAHRETPAPSLLAARTDISPDLDRVFQKMVAKRPDQRYASMTEVIADLEGCLRQAPETAEDLHYFDHQIDNGSDVDLGVAHVSMSLGQGRAGSRSTDESTLIRDLLDVYDTQPSCVPAPSPSSSRASVTTKLPVIHAPPVRSRFKSWSIRVGAVAIAAAGIWVAREQFTVPETDGGNRAATHSPSKNGAQDESAANSKPIDPDLLPPSNVTANTTTAAQESVSGQKSIQSIPAPAASPPPRTVVDDVDSARHRLAALDRELESNPESTGAFNEKSIWYKRLGMWQEATDNAERMADLLPDKSIIRMPAAYIGVLAGDLDAYRRTCRYLIDTFGHSDNVEDLERACKAPLFVTGEFDLSVLPLERFEELIKLDVPDKGPMYWACVTRAYVACRMKQPELALEWLAKREPPRAAFHLYTYSRFVRAQALQQLDRRDEARAAFDEAVSLMPADLAQQLDGKSAAPILLPIESVHGDWLILSILRRQTQTLLSPARETAR